ncbi:MAG TPA: GtrA family protein [Candidatus Saccharimonadales bacterium]|nr:GtrA family protein [Candidatus Saccharimonadales bacterium]
MFGWLVKLVFRGSPQLERAATQFAKYMTGGGLYFVIGYAVFAVCYSGLHWSWFPAKIVSDAIGWTFNYLVQRLWAFKDQIHLTELQHAGRYVFIESVGFVMDYLMIWGLKAIGITPYIGFFISAGFFTVWSFVWYKYWVFPETGGKKARAGH